MGSRSGSVSEKNSYGSTTLLAALPRSFRSERWDPGFRIKVSRTQDPKRKYPSFAKLRLNLPFSACSDYINHLARHLHKKPHACLFKEFPWGRLGECIIVSTSHHHQPITSKSGHAVIPPVHMYTHTCVYNDPFLAHLSQVHEPMFSSKAH
jgi:hypothetical protein